LYAQESLIMRYRIRKKDNNYLWLETIIKPVVDHNEVIKLVCTSRNITGQRIAQDKLKKERPTVVCGFSGDPFAAE